MDEKEDKILNIGDSSEFLQRAAFNLETVDAENRSVELTIATDTQEILRYDWELEERVPQIIIVSGIEIPAKGQVPLLDCHNKYTVRAQLGSIRDFRTVKEDDGLNRLVGRAFYGRTEFAKETFSMVHDGHLTDNSVGLIVLDKITLSKGSTHEADGVTYQGPAVLITKSRLDEGSACPIGADKNATNRADLAHNSEGINQMDDDENNTTPNGEGDKGNVNRTATVPAPAPAPGMSQTQVQNAVNEGVALERARVAGIQELQRNYNLTPEWAAEMQGSDKSLDIVRQDAADKVLERANQPVQTTPSQFYMPSEDKEVFRDSMEDGLLVRCGVLDPMAMPEGQELRGNWGGFASRTQVEIARMFCHKHNLSTEGYPEEILTRAIATSDYATVLGNIANKSVLIGFTEQPETFEDWIDNTGTVNDFKTHTLTRLGEFDDLDEIKEWEEYPYGATEEQKEVYKVAKYGKLFCISREALINDDLNEMSAVPRNMGRAARRKLGDIAYGVLTANPNMGDGVPIFDPAHNNIAVGGDIGAVNNARYTAADVAMGTQKDINGKAFINVNPMFYIASRASKANAEEFFTTKSFSDGNEASTRNNIYFNAVSRTYESRLDEVYGADQAWFLLGNRQMNIKMFYLNGRKTPMLERQDAFKTDGMTWKVRIEAVAKALHWRTMYFNPGA